MVTGALGFISRSLVALLLEEEAEVTMMDKAGADARELARIFGDSNGSLQLLQTDIQDSKSTESYLQCQEIVFNLAGHSGPLGSLEEQLTNLEVNCCGALNLLETIRRASSGARVVFPSSRLVYGRTERLPVDERHPTVPITIYGVHNLTAEGYHRIYCQSYGIETVVLRISNPYGPHKSLPHHRYNIMNWFIDRAVQDKELTVFDGGTQQRDYFTLEILSRPFCWRQR